MPYLRKVMPVGEHAKATGLPFAFSEHLIATYLAEMAGALSEYLHLASIAMVVAAFMPVKRRVDRLVEDYTTKGVVVEF